MISSKLRQSIADRRAEHGDKGFTLIELLVVILIIGILAAIAIPVFLGQQNSANDAAAKSDVANTKLAVIGYYTAGGNLAFTAANTAAANAALLNDYGYSTSTGNAPIIVATSSTVICVSVKSKTNTVYRSTAATNTVDSGAACS